MFRHGTTDTDSTELKFRGFYGKQTLWAIELASAGVLGLAVDIGDMLHGCLKVCLIDRSSNDIQTIAIGSGSIRLSLVLAAGEYSLIIVGYDAWDSLDIHLDTVQASVQLADAWGF